MELNLNMFFDKLTNFKIKFTKNPRSAEVSNKDLVFVVNKGKAWEHKLKFKNIELNKDADLVEIILD